MPRLKMYDKSSTEAWECSRTAIDEFLNDPHTFVMRRKLGLMSVHHFRLISTPPQMRSSKRTLMLYAMFRRVTIGCLRNTTSKPPFQHEDFKRGETVKALELFTNQPILMFTAR